MSVVPTQFPAGTPATDPADDPADDLTAVPDRRDADRGPTGDPATGRVRMPVPVPATVPVPPTGPSAAVVDDRRVVAVATSAAELLRPGSDLARILRSVPSADLLLATDEPRLVPVRIPLPPPVHVDDLPPVELDEHAVAEQEMELPTSVVIDDLDLPGLRVHRLDLGLPLPAGAEDDLVAALSELIGFDPEPGVVCLAPVARTDEESVVSRAAQRVAQVYGLPLLRFGSHDLCGAVAAG